MRDGQILAAVAEELLSPHKHTSEVPKLAIEHCIEMANLDSIKSLDGIVSCEKPLLRFRRVIESMVAIWTARPFTLRNPSVRGEMTAGLPAVTHEDGPSRLQTVRRDVNPEYCDLIDAVRRRSGVPVVVNTSFNVRGEPVVCLPKDAWICFIKTGIDALLIVSDFISGKSTANPLATRMKLRLAPVSPY